MRLPLAVTFASLSFTACGGDADPMPDSGVDNGFTTPAVTLKANMETAPDSDVWMEVGPADLSCLGTANTDQASTAEVALTTRVNDYQEKGVPVPGAMVKVFHVQDPTMEFASGTTDGTGNITLSFPIGVKRFGYKMESTSAMPTLLLNQILASPSEPAQTVTEIRSVSVTTAQTLPALINQTRMPGSGILAGALRDCQKREISGFIATVSSTSGTATPLSGVDTYYFNHAVGLPVHHNQQKHGSRDGLFMIIQIPTTTATAYVQMWGFPTDADLAMGEAGLKLVGELEVPIVADTVITGSYEPLRTN